jgi:hypothetical protein
MSFANTMIRSVLAVLALGWALPSQAQDGFTQLFDQQSLEGWRVDPAYAGNFAVESGVLKVRGEGGWLRTERQYTDYILKLELRYLGEDPGNGRVGLSGVFLRTLGESSYGTGWPDASAEVQLGNRTGFRPALPGDARWAGAVLLHGLPGGLTSFDTAAAMRAYGPTGEWQTVEIHVQGETVSVSVNGHYLGRSQIGSDTAGYIGIQAESGETEIRAIAIREIDARHVARSEEGLTSLFDGRTLTGWRPANPESRTFTVQDGVIRISGREGRGEGFPNVCRGNLFSEQEFGNFRMRFQARYLTGLSDSGFLMRVPVVNGAPSPGLAYQVQMQGMGDPSLPWNGALFRQGNVPQGQSEFDFAAARRAYAPIGEWNDYDIEAYETWITVRINGVVIARAENVGVPRGLLGIQCEVGVVEMRNLAISEIAD